MNLIHRRRIGINRNDTYTTTGKTLLDKTHSAVPVGLVSKKMLMSRVCTLSNQHILLVNQYRVIKSQTIIHINSDGGTECRILRNRREEIARSVCLCNVILDGCCRASRNGFGGRSITIRAEVVIVVVDAVILDVIVVVVDAIIRAADSSNGTTDGKATHHSAKDNGDRYQCDSAELLLQCGAHNIITSYGVRC